MGGMLLIDMFLTEVLYLDLKIKEYLLFLEYSWIKFTIHTLNETILGFNPL
jgi:hypothetical protein